VNESVERAQERTGPVTARQLLALVRKVRKGEDSLYLHGKAVHGRPSYSDAFIFTISAVERHDAFKAIDGRTMRDVETTTTLDVPGWVTDGHTSKAEETTHTDSYNGREYKVARYTEAFRPTKGFWSLTYNETLRDVLELLPGDALVSLHVYLDAGTNEYLVRASAPMNFGTEQGLHGDRLYLVAAHTVRGKAKTRRFLLCSTCGPHNTARFGYGSQSP
jgi:hypothetical protein